MPKDSHPFYPEDWQEISRFIKEACSWQCQECGRHCRRPGEAYDGYERTLTIAHLDQCYDGPVVTVAALCAPCHLRYDAPFAWLSRWRWERWRKRCAGQLSLLPQ